MSLRPRWLSARAPVALLLLLGATGFLFTLRLKYGEFIVLRTFCSWCAISAVAITTITVLAALEWRASGPPGRPRAI